MVIPKQSTQFFTPASMWSGDFELPARESIYFAIGTNGGGTVEIHILGSKFNM